jgi:hypothetical protein
MNPEQMLAKMARELNAKVIIEGQETASGQFVWRVFLARRGTERPITGIYGRESTIFKATVEYLALMRGATIPTPDRGFYQVPMEMTA